MVSKNEILNDPRFYLDEWNLNRFFSDKIEKYEVVEVEVGSIIRELNGKIMTLSETDVFHYLDGSEEDKINYEKYCQEYCAGNDNRGTRQFNNLISTFDSVDYDIKKGAICIDQFGVILEGQHRSCILLKKYGSHYKVKVVRFYITGLRPRMRIGILLWRAKNAFSHK